ncbi:MAG: ABC transporter permease [Chloroflexota bacterium]
MTSAEKAPTPGGGRDQALVGAWKRSFLSEELLRAWRYFRHSPLALTGLTIVLMWVLVSVFAAAVAPYEPLKQDVVNRLQPPSGQHLMGTDQLGRDVLSRIIYGGRISLPIGLLVVALSTLIGTILGSIAGYLGGAVDTALMRLTDMVMGFPGIILAMSIAAALGAGLEKSTLAVVVVWWPHYARIVRSLVMSVRENEYVTAARSLGCREGRVLLRTVLPNCIAPAIVMATMDLGNAILTFSGLSFLGLGAVPPTPEWGTMVASGILVFDQWWVSAFPGLAILSIVMGFNFLGDGLRDALDPRLRRGT